MSQLQPEVLALRGHLTDTIAAQATLLQEYVDTLTPYLTRLNTSTDGVIAAWQRRVLPGRPFPRHRLLRAVKRYHTERDATLAALPASVSLGLFELSLASVRERLSGVSDGIARGLLALAERWCMDTTTLVSKEAAAARAQLRSRCRTVAQAVEVEQFAVTVPGIIATLEAQMREVSELSAELYEDFKYVCC